MSNAPTLTTVADGVARVAWVGEPNIDELRRLVAKALTEHSRVEALIDPADSNAQRTATWSGLLREGVSRGLRVDGEVVARVVYARVADDVPLNDPAASRALLNSFLPRKRAISQLLIRDEQSRVLLCQLTYKSDWDLPGGVVEVGESPHTAVAREVEEELGLRIDPGPLLLTDWLPPWGGWDDAVCLVFDGGLRHPDLLHEIVKQEREIQDVRFCTPAEVEELAADFTARRIRAALAGNLDYTESGRPVRI